MREWGGGRWLSHAIGSLSKGVSEGRMSIGREEFSLLIAYLDTAKFVMSNCLAVTETT